MTEDIVLIGTDGAHKIKCVILHQVHSNSQKKTKESDG